MSKRQTRKLLKKYLSGKCTAQERQLIEQWYHGETERRRTGRPQDEKRVRRLSVTTALKIAASIILLLGAGYLLQRSWPSKPAWQEIAATTHPLKMQLPDGTQLWLNSGSRLRYPAKFDGAERRVELLTGEACLEVKQDPAHPFLIRSGSIQTRVLGTVFNVRALQQLDLLQVTVSEGKVAVIADDSLQQLSGHEVILLPDEQLTLNSHLGEWKKEHTDGAAVSSWTTGKLLFNNERLDIIALQLEHRYHVKILFVDNILPAYRITAGFSPADPLEEVLQVLGMANKLKYEIKHGRVTFSRQSP
jgi:ferric-dicitrate binding protein FerR (iron transport regulator)